MRGVRTILVGGILVALALPVTSHASGSAWTLAKSSEAPRAADVTVEASRFKSFELNEGALERALAGAPLEGRGTPTVISVPGPGGTLQRFEVSESPVMESRIAAQNPDIQTYAGRGIDDPSASIRFDLTPLGFHASVLSERGAWYVDPLTFPERGVYASFRKRDLPEDAEPPLAGGEEVLDPSDASLGNHAESPTARAGEPDSQSGGTVVQRVYRIAMANDPAFAEFYGGDDESVLAAKATIVNRMNQLFNDDLAIKLVLVNNTDELNFGTEADYSGPDGPCGDAPCFTSTGCHYGDVIYENAIVMGQFVGASNFDVGHFLAGNPGGGGIAWSGGIGTGAKALACSSVGGPGSDPIINESLAHELGHQFGSGHTFDSCGGDRTNRSDYAAVEPGSGSSVMSYAGICGDDDLQTIFDPLFSQQSIEDINAEVTSPNFFIDFNEFQSVSFRDWGAGDSFRIGFKGEISPPIVAGENYSKSGIEEAVAAIPGWPDDASVFAIGPGPYFLLGRFPENDYPTSDGFQVEFGGSLGQADVPLLSIEDARGFAAIVGDTYAGGKGDTGGSPVSTSNAAPRVSATADATIPIRTPFELKGRGGDEDGDPLVYSWEQNDIDDTSDVGTPLFSNTKTEGPLFRIGSEVGDGEPVASASPVRVFPDLGQIATGNTNAASGTCDVLDVDCFSEFLPTASSADRLNFRLTARDRAVEGGGVGDEDVTLTVAKSAGPFRVTSHGEPAALTAGQQTELRWDVAGTAGEPVSAKKVDIAFSVDGGLTFPFTLVDGTANDGTETIDVPNIDTTRGRFRVKASDNVFFDTSHADLSISSAANDLEDPITEITSGPFGGRKASVLNERFEFSADEPAEFRCSFDGAAYEPCSSAELLPGSYGRHTFSVYARDVAGNVDATPETRAFRVGPEAPETRITRGPADGAKISNRNPQFFFKADEPSDFYCKVDQRPRRTCTSPIELPTLSPGLHRFSVRARDDDRNYDFTPAVRSFVVKGGGLDTRPPQTRITSGPKDGKTTSITSHDFKFEADEISSSFECSFDRADFEPCRWSYYASTEDGPHTFAVRATDRAGNTDPTPARRSFVVEATAGPETLIDHRPPDKVRVLPGKRQRNVRYEFSSDVAGTFECSVGGADWSACTPYSQFALGIGTWTVLVRAIDTRGLADETPARDTVTVKRAKRRG